MAFHLATEYRDRTAQLRHQGANQTKSRRGNGRVANPVITHEIPCSSTDRVCFPDAAPAVVLLAESRDGPFLAISATDQSGAD